MTHIETTQITFGKATKKMITELIPSAKSFKKVGSDFLIKNVNGQTIATWHKRSLKNGLLIVWP